MRFPLIIEGSVKNLKVSHNNKTKFTKVQLGKYTATSKGKKLTAEGLWPISLVIGDLKLKIIAKYSKKHKKYDLWPGAPMSRESSSVTMSDSWTD